MLKIKPKNILLFVSIFLLIGTTFSSAQEDVFPNVKAIQIAGAKAEKGDTARMGALNKKGAKINTAESPVYVVKLYFDSNIPVDDLGFKIFIGDKEVNEFGSFKNGIYFKIYDVKELRRLKGKEILVHRKDKVKKTGKYLPDIDSLSDSQNYQLKNNQGIPSIGDVLKE